MKKVKGLNGLIYFLSNESYDLIVNQSNPGTQDLHRYALAVIDPMKCEVVKTRYTLEDVFTEALKGK